MTGGTLRAMRAARQRSRREEYSDATRKALLDAATRLFAERGYTGTALDEVAARARVTKGALYHHFPQGKRGLFEAVYQRMEARVIGDITAIVEGQTDPVAIARDGLAAFLDACLDPSYQRIVLREAPMALGHEAWREHEERFALGLVRAVIAGLIDAGELPPLPADTLSRVMFGALAGGALTIADATDKKRARDEVRACMEALLTGLRAINRPAADR